MTTRYTSERGQGEGYYFICENGVVIAKSKSHYMAKKIVAALEAYDGTQTKLEPDLQGRQATGDESVQPRT